MLDIFNERSTSLLAYSITLVILSTIAVIMRLISRRISAAKFWWDDVFILISLLDSYATYIIVFIDVHHGMGRQAQFVTIPESIVLLEMIYANEVHYPFSISAIKLAILLFYFRLFEFREGFRKILYATGALVISWCIGLTFPAIFKCTPISAAFIFDKLYQEQNCIDGHAYVIFGSVFNVLLDVWILILPLFIVWTLQLSQRRKYGLSGIFLLGAFTIGASLARAYYVINVDTLDITRSSTTPVIWSSIEISVGIICACLPTLQPVLRVSGRKFVEITSFWSGDINQDKDLWYLESPVRKKGGTPPKLDENKARFRLSLGDVSWRALDYEGFGSDNALKEFGMKNPLP